MGRVRVSASVSLILTCERQVSRQGGKPQSVECAGVSKFRRTRIAKGRLPTAGRQRAVLRTNRLATSIGVPVGIADATQTQNLRIKRAVLNPVPFAKKLGVRVVEEQEFLEMIGQ